jgi:hypothetical protein
LTQLKGFFSNLNIVTKEENSGKEAKSQKIKCNLKALFMYPQMPGFGSLLTKDQYIKVVFLQNNPLALNLSVFKNLILNTKLKIPSQGFFEISEKVSKSLITQIMTDYTDFLKDSEGLGYLLIATN